MTIWKAVFQGIEPAPVVFENGEVTPAWTYLTPKNSIARKYGADSRIRGSHVATPLNELSKLRNDHMDIFILSGVHGNRYGNNWIVEHDNNGPQRPLPHIIRNRELSEEGFLKEDIERYIGRQSYERDFKRRIKIVDIGELSVYLFGDYVRNTGCHVILAFCYGRNDMALRYYLNALPVNSRVKSTASDEC